MGWLDSPKMLLCSWARTSPSRKIFNYCIDFSSGNAEWYRLDYSIDNLLDLTFDPIIPLKTFTSWPSPSYWAFASSLSHWTLVVITSTWIPSSWSIVVFSLSSRWVSIPLWRLVWASVSLDELIEVTNLNKFFNFVFQWLTVFGRVTIIAMILAVFRCICVP